MEQDNLLQHSSINEEEEEHNEEEKERIDHPLTISTSNNEHIIDVSNFGNDSINAHVVENYYSEDSFLAFESIDIDELNMRPVEKCHKHLNENALVSKERQIAVVPKYNHLQESRDEKEEH